jgi:hypothetical protein
MRKRVAANRFSLAIEYHREEDGRWLADIPALPGVTAYGRSKKQATAPVQALALRSRWVYAWSHRCTLKRAEAGDATPLTSATTG